MGQVVSEETETAESADETVAGTSHGAGGDETEVVGPDSGDVDRQALRAYLAGRAAGARAAAARGRTVDTALSGATTASPRGADAPTVVVPPATVDAAGLAWSLDDADDDDSSPVEPQSWRLTLGYTAVLVSIAFVVALVVGVVGWVVFVLPEAPPRPGDPAYIPPPLPPSSIGPWTTPNAVTPSPVAAPPATVTVTPSPITPTTVTVQAAPTLPPTDSSWTPEQLATSTCDVLWGGGSQADAIQFVRNKTGWDFGPAQRWTAQATSITCPGARH